MLFRIDNAVRSFVRMNRYLSCIQRLALCTGVVLAFSGCAGGGTSDRDPHVVRFWHFWSEPGQKQALRELVREFEQSRNVKVELTELSWNDGKMKLQAAFNSGAPPDVIELGSDWVAQFSSAGVLMQLPGDALSVGRFVPYSLAPATWNNRIYAYPWTIDTRVLYVNLDALESIGVDTPPSTLDDVADIAERLHENGTFGWGANGADAHRLYKKILPLMWTYGGDVLDRDGRPTLASAANIAALEMYARLARTGMIETQRQLDAAFVQGKIGIWNSGSWLLKKIDATPKLRVRPVLQPGLGSRPGVSFAGGEYLAVSATTANTQMARELVEFLIKGPNAVRFCRSVPEAGFPADSAYVRDQALIAHPMKAVFALQLSSARMTPVHPRWLDLEEILEDAVERVLLGEANPAGSLERAQHDAEVLLGKR